MKIPTISIILVVFALDKGWAFVPPVVPVVSTTLRPAGWLTMVKTDKDWITNVRDWFDSVTTHTKEKANDDWISQEFEDQAAIVEKENQPTIYETKDAWIARDMAEAGKAEDESTDWVAKDMNHAGRDPSHQDVQWEMKDAGGSITRDVLKKKNKKSRNDLIQDDMKRAGLNTSSDWIKRDMEDAGKGPKKEIMRNNVERLLDKEGDKYKDIYNDMKKVGKDATRTDWIADRMTTAGKGEHIRSAKKEDYSYKLDKNIQEHYNIDHIRADMEQAGHADSQDWIQHDMEDVGRSHDNVGAKKQPLKQALSRNEPAGIMEDLVRAGKANMSDAWIAKDMERAGHPDVHLNTGTPFKTHEDRETEEFMATRKSLKVEGPEEENETNQEVPKEKRRILTMIKKVLKKVIKPWKNWGDL
jgi:hypothetical protein